ncbi:hypothetical protein, partial [Campylobacter jejuni]
MLYKEKNRMNLIPEILDLQGEFEKIRHQIHENPEL